MSKLTSRQVYHLAILSDGRFHRTNNPDTHASVFGYLTQRGLVEMRQQKVIEWRITEAGRVAYTPHLTSAGQTSTRP